MGLSAGRTDKAAIAPEQPHRGTAATPLATATLNQRHGQGAVPSRLRLKQGLGLSLLLTLMGLVTYYFHERLWARIAWGRPPL